MACDLTRFDYLLRSQGFYRNTAKATDSCVSWISNQFEVFVYADRYELYHSCGSWLSTGNLFNVLLQIIKLYKTQEHTPC